MTSGTIFQNIGALFDFLIEEDANEVNIKKIRQEGNEIELQVNIKAEGGIESTFTIKGKSEVPES